VRILHFLPGSTFAFALALSAACPPAEQSATPDCATYCATVTARCTESMAQYESEAACNEYCTGNAITWGVGTTADAAGNTLGCRQYHAGAAGNDEHCLHAGPTGGGVCGSYCDVYCDAAMANCADGNALYGDRDACIAACAAMPTNGDVNASGGDSVQCRVYHLGAAKTDPAGHCAHGSQSGGDVCGTWCQVYCDIMDVNCPNEYSGAAACDTACGAFAEDGQIGDASGDTVQCRIFHAGVANNDDHCNHASADSTADTCSGGGSGVTCADYCATVSDNCTGGSLQYATEQACLEFCNSNPLNWGTGTVDDTDVNTLGCRIYHAGAANNDDHCDHAGPTGGGACGSYCDVYCAAMSCYCPAEYANTAACTTACTAFPATGDVNDADGNTVQCRIYHAGFAKTDASHCDHADEDSATGTCL